MKYNPQKHHRKSIRLKGYDYSKEGLYFITICCHDRECLFGQIENDEMILNDAGKFANECWLEIPEHFPNAVLHEHIVMPNHIHGIIELTQNVVPNVGAENFLPDDNDIVPDNNDVVHNVGAENFLPLPPNDTAQSVHENFHERVEKFRERVENFQPPRNEFQKMIPRSIGAIVKGFKIGVTKWFRDNTGTVGAENFLPDVDGVVSDDNIVVPVINDIVPNAGAENFLPDVNGVVPNAGAENFLPLPPQPTQPPHKRSSKQPVWQRNYHEHIIRNEQSYHNISNYIINNPAKWNDDKFHKK